MASLGKEELDRQGAAESREDETEAGSKVAAVPGEVAAAPEVVASVPEDGRDGRSGPDEPEGQAASPREGLTPREARQVRAVTGAVFMACIAVALVVQLGNGQPSLLTIGSYGVGLVLSGVAIKLSYRGRTRVASAVLVTGFLLAVVAERLLAVL